MLFVCCCSVSVCSFVSLELKLSVWAWFCKFLSELTHTLSNSIQTNILKICLITTVQATCLVHVKPCRLRIENYESKADLSRHRKEGLIRSEPLDPVLALSNGKGLGAFLGILLYFIFPYQNNSFFCVVFLPSMIFHFYSFPHYSLNISVY